MVNLHSQQLHRWLAQQDSESCFLLFDPQLRPLEVDSELALALDATPIPVHLPQVSGKACPWLVQLDSQRASGSAAIAASLQQAHSELDLRNLQRGQGRRIGGWLHSHAAGSTIAAHLERTLVQTTPDRRRMLLRLQDPAVLWAMWGVLTPAQHAALMGPIATWWLINPAGHLVMLQNPAPSQENIAIPKPLHLDAAQWQHALRLRAFNAALNTWLKERQNAAILAPTPQDMQHIASRLLQLLHQAQVNGLQDTDEQVQYSLEALHTPQEQKIG